MADIPRDLDPERITHALGTKRIGRRVVAHAVVGSTMDVLGSLAHGGEPEGTVLIADRQMSGRGRLGRAWLAPPGSSLLLSMLFRPTVDVERTGQVMMTVALGALDVLDDLLATDHAVALKWPNDILVDGLKVAGMLAEGRLSADGNNAVVVGIGMNVSQTAEVLPPGATSLLVLSGDVVPRDELCVNLLRAVDRHYDDLLTGSDIVAPWSARLDTIGRTVSASGGGADVTGTAIGVSPKGGLLIRTRTGQVVTVHAGDVTLVNG